MSRRIRTYAEVAGTDRSDLSGQLRAQAERVGRRLERVRHVVGVMSGKGGVGKSLLAAGLALATTRHAARTGLLDADLASPTARRFLGLDRPTLTVEDGAVRPLETGSGVALISTDLLLPAGAPLEWSGPDADRFVWRGAQERGALREFLADVAWGRRDLLLVDLPPGTNRVVDLAELVPRLAGVVAVTLPSATSGDSVERSLALCGRREIPVLGIVENMAGHLCPSCGSGGDSFPGEAGARLAAAFEIPLLGRIPFDPDFGRRAEAGELEAALEATRAGREILRLADDLLARLRAAEARPPVASRRAP